MSKAVPKYFFIHCLLFTLINSSCISNTPCKCSVNEYSFILTNCSYTLPNLPIFNLNITKIVAQNALIHWPTHLCKYLNIQILDLSYSHFNNKFIDLSCLYELIHLNLSSSYIKTLPNFEKNFLKNLQFIDLSNNRIEILDGKSFRLLKNLRHLYLQNNPFKRINSLEYLLNLPQLQYLNLNCNICSIIPIQKSLTIYKWINLAYKWNNTRKSMIIQTNIIPLQMIFPETKQLKLISINLMKIILQTLSKSTFTALHFTPKCNCQDLWTYQQMISFNNFTTNLPSLYQSTTCLMPNGFIHARLFDQRTLFDLNCLEKKTKLSNSSSLLNYHLFILFFMFYVFFFINKKD